MEGKPTKRTDALAADRAFVVQFRASSGDRPLTSLAGRVEHVHSGAVQHFESLDELLTFLERALDGPQVKAKTAGAPGGDTS
jgi:hypothetical protein